MEDEKQQFNAKNEQYSEENYRIMRVFDKQIWAKINDGVKDFGETNKYDFIFGANGSGGLLYESKGGDITDQIIKFSYQKAAAEKK